MAHLSEFLVHYTGSCVRHTNVLLRLCEESGECSTALDIVNSTIKARLVSRAAPSCVRVAALFYILLGIVLEHHIASETALHGLKVQLRDRGL